MNNDLKKYMKSEQFAHFKNLSFEFQAFLDNLDNLELNSLELKKGYITYSYLEESKSLYNYFNSCVKMIFNFYNYKRQDLVLSIKGSNVYLYDCLIATMMNIVLRNSLVYCEEVPSFSSENAIKVESLHSNSVLREVSISVAKYFLGNFLSKSWILDDKELEQTVYKRCINLQKSLIEAKEAFLKIYKDNSIKFSVKEAFYE